MELILDTADVEAIKEYNSIMRLSGVTTNPKIIGVTGKQPLDAARDVIACRSWRCVCSWRRAALESK